MQPITNNTGYSQTSAVDPVNEVISARPHISWRAIFAGAFVAILVNMLLTALGIAVGGMGLEHVVREGGAAGLSIGAGIWFVLSGVIALAVGSYVGARSSGLVPSRVGGIEGLVVASLLFVTLFVGLGSGIGVLGRGAGSLMGAAGRGVTDLAGNDQVRSVVQSAIGQFDLRSDPTTVAQNVGSMLLRGDDEGATNYLASQAGIRPAEARARLDQTKAQVETTAKSVGASIARGTQYAGWTMFVTILLGSAAGLFGGAFGARRNFTQPMSDRDRRLAIESRQQWVTRPQETVREAPSPS